MNIELSLLCAHLCLLIDAVEDKVDIMEYFHSSTDFSEFCIVRHNGVTQNDNKFGSIHFCVVCRIQNTTLSFGLCE
jgi:hypothetical protein